VTHFISRKERNHFPTIDSNTLAMVGRSDIGLRSLQMDVGQKTLLELRSNNTVVTRSSAFVILSSPLESIKTNFTRARDY